MAKESARKESTQAHEGGDIESYLLTFERFMTAHAIQQAHWVIKLAPQLTGCMQQAYTAMRVTDATTYTKVKKPIL